MEFHRERRAPVVRIRQLLEHRLESLPPVHGDGVGSAVSAVRNRRFQGARSEPDRVAVPGTGLGVCHGRAAVGRRPHQDHIAERGNHLGRVRPGVRRESGGQRDFGPAIGFRQLQRAQRRDALRLGGRCKQDDQGECQHGGKDERLRAAQCATATIRAGRVEFGRLNRWCYSCRRHPMPFEGDAGPRSRALRTGGNRSGLTRPGAPKHRFRARSRFMLSWLRSMSVGHGAGIAGRSASDPYPG